MGGGTATQEGLLFVTDSTQNMYNYILNAGGFGADKDLTTTFCNESLDLYSWLTNTLGVKFNQVFQDRYPAAANPTWGLYWSGDENHYSSVATPVPRGHTVMGIPDNTTHSGSGVFQPLQTAVQKAGSQILYNTLGQKLVVNPQSGRVVGVEATQGSKSIFVEAKRAVVLTAGGFAYNPDMIAMYAPAFTGVSPLGTPGDDGSGIKMGQAVGADLRNMSDVFAAGFTTAPDISGSTVIDYYNPGCMGIMVNQQGLRYMAEDHYLSWAGIAIIEQNNPSYLIIDSAIYKTCNSPTSVATAGTIHDLGVALKMPSGVLEDTVALYNSYAQNGQDPIFNKYKGLIAPITTAPFYALMAIGTAAFTMGGLRTNATSQVLDTAGNPIPGLYSAGRNAAQICASNYQGSGTSYASALIFGRIAGQKAAAETPWTS